MQLYESGCVHNGSKAPTLLFPLTFKATNLDSENLNMTKANFKYFKLKQPKIIEGR